MDPKWTYKKKSTSYGSGRPMGRIASPLEVPRFPRNEDLACLQENIRISCGCGKSKSRAGNCLVEIHRISFDIEAHHNDAKTRFWRVGDHDLEGPPASRPQPKGERNAAPKSPFCETSPHLDRDKKRVEILAEALGNNSSISAPSTLH